MNEISLNLLQKISQSNVVNLQTYLFNLFVLPSDKSRRGSGKVASLRTGVVTLCVNFYSV